MAAPTAQNVYVKAQMALGTIGPLNLLPLNFSDTSSIAASIGDVPFQLPANLAEQTINWATLFPGITTFKYIWIQEVTAGGLTGFKLANTSGGTFIDYKLGIYVGCPNGAGPTLYAKAASGAIAYLLIGAIGT